MAAIAAKELPCAFADGPTRTRGTDHAHLSLRAQGILSVVLSPDDDLRVVKEVVANRHFISSGGPLQLAARSRRMRLGADGRTAPFDCAPFGHTAQGAPLFLAPKSKRAQSKPFRLQKPRPYATLTFAFVQASTLAVITIITFESSPALLPRVSSILVVPYTTSSGRSQTKYLPAGRHTRTSAVANPAPGSRTARG